MDSPITKHTFKRAQADKLLDYFNEIYPEDLVSCCSHFGIQLSELVPADLATFDKKGTPSGTSTHRLVHHEERRLAKILKIASELSKSLERNPKIVTPSLTSLYKSLEIPTATNSVNSSLIIENFSVFHKPDDLIQYTTEKTKRKFNKSVEVIKRLESIKAEEKRKADELVKKVEEKDKKIMQNLNKRDEMMGKHNNSLEDYRNKILQKKKKINFDIEQKFQNFGNKLKNRLENLSQDHQRKLVQLMKQQQDKIKKKVDDEYLKMTQFHSVNKAQFIEVENSVQEVEDKIRKRLEKYEENIQRRIMNAKENNEKVDKIFSKSIEDSNRKNEEKLAKLVEKSFELEHKRMKKQEKFQKYSNTMKNTVMSSFFRTSKGIEGLNQNEVKRIEKIENRVNEKNKIFNEIKNRFEENMKVKKQKNSNRFVHHSLNYSNALENKAKFRTRIIEEHQRINQITEDFKNKKNEISKMKKSDNFEIQKLRSAFTASIHKRYLPGGKLDETF